MVRPNLTEPPSSAEPEPEPERFGLTLSLTHLIPRKNSDRFLTLFSWFSISCEIDQMRPYVCPFHFPGKSYLLEIFPVPSLSSFFIFFAGKEEVKDGEPAKWTKKNNLPEVTKSWHDYMIREVVQDFQHAVLQVSDMPYEEEVVSNIPQVSYEFPNGYSNEFGIERFKISEALFDPNKIRVPNANTMLSVAHVVTTSVGKEKKKSLPPMSIPQKPINNSFFSCIYRHV